MEPHESLYSSNQTSELELAVGHKISIQYSQQTPDNKRNGMRAQTKDPLSFKPPKICFALVRLELKAVRNPSAVVVVDVLRSVVSMIMSLEYGRY